MSAIRVFVGVAPNGSDAESAAVLDYTLHKHASRPLEITWMALSKDPASPFYSDPAIGAGWRTNLWPTPFSCFRNAVSEICGFEGKAIYMDSDCLALADIAELWDQEFLPGKCIIAKDAGRLCVSLWDCRRARDLVLPMDLLRQVNGHQVMRQRIIQSGAVQAFEGGNFNCLDGEKYERIDDPEIKVIHYTDMSAQPHLKHALPRLAAVGQRHWYDGPIREHWRKDLIALFDALLSEAEAAGFARENYVPLSMFGHIPKNSLVNHPGRHPR